MTFELKYFPKPETDGSYKELYEYCYKLEQILKAIIKDKKSVKNKERKY